MEENKVKGTLSEALLQLKAVLKSAYNLAPLLVATICLIVIFITYIVIASAKLMMGVVLLVVLSVTVLVYATNSNFGEAALALVAGLLTAYSVTWSPNKFIAFIAVWTAFSTLAIVISSVKLASKSESLYRQAAIALSEKESKPMIITKQHIRTGKRLRIN